MSDAQSKADKGRMVAKTRQMERQRSRRGPLSTAFGKRTLPRYRLQQLRRRILAAIKHGKFADFWRQQVPAQGWATKPKP